MKNEKYNIIIKFLILFIILVYILDIINHFKSKNNLYKNGLNVVNYSYKYDIPKYLSHLNITFNITYINYSFSFDYNISKIEYNFGFYNDNYNLIKPSELTLYHKLHVFCLITERNNNISVISLANIYKNKYYKCTEFFKTKEKINIGIKIYKDLDYIVKIDDLSINLFTDNIINYKNLLYKKDNEFTPNFITKEFFKNYQGINLKLKKSYYDFPNFYIKSYINITFQWIYKNIYNYYFCFCKNYLNEKCSFENIPKKCKYYFYLSIIDDNKNLYNKTDYLFSDFFSSYSSPGEAYLIFEEMIKSNMSVHYMTKRRDIYLKYKSFNNMPIIYDNYYIDGDFLEKYLDLFLKLKATICGAAIYSIDNIFYNLDYITYICIGHGISYLKDYLYKGYYGKKKYNKILLPPSDKIISNAMKFGWTENNIIKIGLPRWDSLVNYKNKNQLKNNQSIFIMFTWRKFKKKKKVSQIYFKNINKLLNNKELNELIIKNNITIYFSIHHEMIKYKKYFFLNKFVKYINQESINECLKKSSLLITDFSSIIFDFMVCNKPFIIYIPDSDDINIKERYSKNYYNIINNLKKGKIYFENKFFNIQKVINKIMYYINNNFKLDIKLKKFYNKFKLKGGNNIKYFVDYLIKLK